MSFLIGVYLHLEFTADQALVDEEVEPDKESIKTLLQLRLKQMFLAGLTRNDASDAPIVNALGIENEQLGLAIPLTIASDRVAVEATYQRLAGLIRYPPVTFSIVSLKHCFSEFHVDSCGYATHIKIVNDGGMKLWIFVRGRHSDLMPYTAAVHEDTPDPKDFIFEAIVLKGGDTL